MDREEDVLKIENMPFTLFPGDNDVIQNHPGENGESVWRVLEDGDVRVRVVDYSAGFKSDHWCPRGHALLVLSGELIIDLKNGRRHVLAPGTGFLAGDDADNPHLAWTEKGAKVFIVD